MARFATIALVVGLVLALAFAAGCAPEQAATPRPAETTSSAPPTVTPEPVSTQPALVYLTRGESLGVGGRELPVAHPVSVVIDGAVKALLAGPTAEEARFGLGSEIPSDTALNSVVVENGTATVDLSRRFESGGGSLSMLLRVSQVVHTLTQFPGVERVAFKLDGEAVESIGGEGVIVSPPVNRADFEGQLPAILVERPVPGQDVTSPVTVAGSANVFEAQFMAKVTDPDGNVVAEVPVKATSGTGTRGTFDTSIPFKTPRAGMGAVTVFEESAKDGTPINTIDIPVRLTQ